MEYRRFGVMLDCSRNAVMKPTKVKELIDILKKFGYNCIKLYTEDTYEVEGEPYFGYLRGRYTGEQIRDIDAYARAQGVELIPCIQTLAHFDAPKKNFAMDYLFDIDDILLCGEEKTYEFLDRCFASVAKNFTSKTVNIGMDEAHLLGCGTYFFRHGYRPKFEILTEHLNRVCALAKKHGLEPLMWSDMFFRLVNDGGYYGRDLHVPKDVIAQLPDNISLAYWDYHTQDKETYDSMFASHYEMGRPVWFVGGAWTWQGPAPFNRYTLWSMKPAMQSVREHGVQDVIITMWGDGGKECSTFSILPALYTIRQYAEGNFDDAKIAADFEALMGISYADFCTLDLPNDTGKERWNGTGWPENPCKCLLYQDPFLGFYDVDWSRRDPVDYADYAARLRDAGTRAGAFAYLFENLANLCDVLAIKATLGIRTRAAYDAKDRATLAVLVGEFDEVMARTEKFYNSFYDLWHYENNPVGWEVQDHRLGGLLRRLASCRRKLEDYLSGKIDRIEELDERVLPTAKTDMIESNFGRIITRNIF